MGEDAVHREREQIAEAEFALAVGSPLAVVFDAELIEAERGQRAAQVGALVVDAREHVEHLSVDKPKITGVVGELVFAEPIDQAIEDFAGERYQRALDPLLANTIDDRVALFPALHEVDDELGRVLQIAVDLNCRVATRLQVAGEDAALEAEVAREAKHAHARVTRREARQLREGGVGRMVVGEDVLPVVAVGDRRERGLDGSM